MSAALRNSTSSGIEFVYARLHGWWSSSAQGPALAALASSATMENFLHELQSRRILAVKEPEHAGFEIQLRQYSRLTALAREAGPAAEYVLACREAITIENFKTLLNYRFFPERAARVTDLLVPYPDSGANAGILEDVLAATDTEQFIRLLPRQLATLPGVAEIIRRLDDDRDFVAASAGIDAIVLQRLDAAIATLPATMRRVAARLHGAWRDCVNATTILRNQHFHHLDASALGPFWLDGGTELPRDLWDKLADAPGPDAAALLASLPPAVQRLARGTTPRQPNAPPPSMEVAAIENRMRNAVHAIALRYFHDPDTPERALPAYVWLLDDETINLRRLHEALRFSLPLPEITAMLIT